jgi:hypothetical protein
MQGSPSPCFSQTRSGFPFFGANSMTQVVKMKRAVQLSVLVRVSQNIAAITSDEQDFRPNASYRGAEGVAC